MNSTRLIASAIAVAIIFWGGYSLGTNLTEGAWAKADKAALELQIKLDDEAAAKLKKAETDLGKADKRLAANETKLLDVTAKLNEAINREPTVNETIIEVPGECSVRVVATDPNAFVRLFNAAITASPYQLRDSITAGAGYDSLRRTGYDASVFGSIKNN